MLFSRESFKVEKEEITYLFQILESFYKGQNPTSLGLWDDRLMDQVYAPIF